MTGAADGGARRWLVLASTVASFFAVGVGYFSMPPLLPLLATRFGLDNLMSGVLMGSIAVPAIVLSVPIGAGLDRWSPRAAGAAGLALMALGGALCAAASGYALLLAGRVAFGVGGLVINLLGARLLARVFAGRELSLAMALFLAAYPVSMIACFTVQPWIEGALGWRASLAPAPLLSLLALPLHLAVVAPDAAAPAAARPRARVAPGMPLLALALSWCLFFAAYASLVTFAPAWAGSSGLLVVSTVAWVSLAASPFAGSLIDRAGGARWWAAGGLLALAATLAAMAAAAAPPLLAMVLVGAVVAVVPTAVYSLPGRLVAPETVGLAFGLITSFSNAGAVLGPALAGALRDRTPSWAALWLALSATVALASVLALAARPRR